MPDHGFARLAGRLARPADPGPAADRDLLARFLQAQDEAAFAALVGRHERLVRSAVAKVLADPDDADDAFQATFLVLVRRARAVDWRAGLGPWLYGVAHRVAVKARAASRSRAAREGKAPPAGPTPPPDLSWREACDLLHAELDRLPDRYRAPLLLCYLDGKTRDEAAAALGVTPGTVKGRLERGRVLLRARLEAKGVTLSAGLLAAVAAPSAVGAGVSGVPAVLEAVRGAGSARVAALTREAVMASVLSQWTKALGVALGVGTAAVAVVAAGAAGPQAMPKENPAAKADKSDPAAGGKAVAGRVVGPDGKPVAGAVIAVPGKPPTRPPFDQPPPVEVARADADGRFRCDLPAEAGGPDYRTLVARAPGLGPDWVDVAAIPAGEPVTFQLVPDDVPVRGRVTDLEGKPVPGAVVAVKMIHAHPSGDLGPVWERWRSDPSRALSLVDKMTVAAAAGLPPVVTADKDGRFEVTGVGRGRLLAVVFRAPGQAVANARVATVRGFDPRAVAPTADTRMPGMPERAAPDLYGPEFTHAAQPEAVITGVVTDAKTGRPMAGVQVNGEVENGWWENSNYAITATGPDGRYRVTGVPKAARRKVQVYPGEDSPYLPAGQPVADTAGLSEATADVKLTRGVLVRGRVTDAATGKPVGGAGIRYNPLAGNKYFASTPGTATGMLSFGGSTDADGRFRLVVLPGVGLISAQDETRTVNYRTRYTQVRVRPADEGRLVREVRAGLGETFLAADRHHESLVHQSAYQVIDPAEGADAVTVELQFDPGKAVSGTVVDPDGKPAAGVTAYKLTATYDRPVPLPDGAFTAVAVDPKYPRPVVFVHPGRKLAGVATVTGEEKAPVVVKLRPWAAVKGRLGDADGKPVAGAEVSLRPAAEDPYSGYNGGGATAETAADGTFRVDVPLADVPFRLDFRVKNKYPQPAKPLDKLTVPAGGTKDLGDVRVEAGD